MTDHNVIKVHKDIMAEADAMNNTHGVRQKGGKKYLEVKHRITALRKNYAIALGIDTTLLEATEKFVRVQAKITDPEGRIVGSGMAEEYRDDGYVNKTSALENAETSAIGRALASLGLHGGEYASANELDAVDRKTEHQADAPAPMPDDPIPGNEDYSKGPNHPSHDWQAWADKQVSAIQVMTQPAEPPKWLNNNKDYLKQLRQEQSFIADVLLENYKSKKEELNK
jgi:hypothetical protein